MQDTITVDDLRRRLTAGAQIRWCGAVNNDTLLVELVAGTSSTIHAVDVDRELSLVGSNGVVRNGESEEPGTVVLPIPPNTDFFAILRKASVLGINIGGQAISGSALMYNNITGCSCAYDIELDLRHHTRGGFPLPSASILSVAIWCTCGYKAFITRLECDLENTTVLHSDTSIVSETIRLIVSHRPLWLIGWNCYSFDNTCLAYHADSRLHSMFKKAKVGSASTVDYGYILNLPGVYNIDVYGYMQRNPSHSSKYENLSLYSVAKQLGTKLKTNMPDLYIDMSPGEVMEYNMNDCVVTTEIWLKLKLDVEIPSLAVCASAPVYDCVRYMTGALAGCSFASDAVSRDMLVDWSRCERVLKYEGGKVMEPLRGLHNNVVICDYSSMYPTIMIDGGICPENITILTSSGKLYGSVWFDSENLYVELDDHVACFSRKANLVQRDCLAKFVEMRSKVRKSSPTYGNALKISANSAYGSMGYENSPMYSPSCSSSVTAVGRWCLDIATSCFTEVGLKVTYGDTDSCFVASTPITMSDYNNDIGSHARVALSLLHERLATTPFVSMRMEIESYHPKLLLVGKKNYCKLNTDGTVQYKGLSVVRRDRLGLSKEACKVACESVIMSSNTTEATQTIGKYLCNVINKVISRTLAPTQVSMIKKRDSKVCYVYTGIDGLERVIPCDIAPNTIPDFKLSTVLESVRTEIHRVTIPCGLGTTHDIMKRYNGF